MITNDFNTKENIMCKESYKSFMDLLDREGDAVFTHLDDEYSTYILEDIIKVVQGEMSKDELIKKLVGYVQSACEIHRDENDLIVTYEHDLMDDVEQALNK
jgi:hypothetical protein